MFGAAHFSYQQPKRNKRRQTSMMTTSPFAEERLVTNIEDCYFYHTMDIPGHGVVEGEWDLRANIGNYLGGYNFQGQRVLDVGAASGLLTFFTENKGANVVSYDLSEHHSWDVVPYADADLSKIDTTRRDHMRRINNAYWFCHRLHGSRASASYGSVYDIPKTIGQVDVSIYGSILLHLRDPFLALSSAAGLTKSAMIVADVCPFGRFGQFLTNPRFIPNPSRRSPWDTWWNLPPRLIQKYLAILGFPHSEVTWHRQLYQHKPKTLYTVVGYREKP